MSDRAVDFYAAAGDLIAALDAGNVSSEELERSWEAVKAQERSR